MPWKETDPMTERLQFIAAYLHQVYSMTELCERFSIRRNTGYKWVRRYTEQGLAGLQEKSRAPHRCPHRMSEEAAAVLLEAKQAHPHWGPRKILAYLARRRPALHLPAPRTAGELFQRTGLSQARRRRRRHRHPGASPLQAEAPNAVWTADFKGQFRTGDGRYCYPLTVLDRFSRYGLICHGMREPTGRETRAQFLAVFRTHGLPRVLRTDNGTPFASTGLAGLSQLAVWWLRLGIRLDRITPGHPEENGSHERFHRTLKAETACPPDADLRRQQQRFDQHRRVYNDERPHEALNDQVPAQLYTPSPRPLPAPIPPPRYPGHYEVRRVGTNGCVKWDGTWLFLTTALIGEEVGFEPVDDGLWTLHLAEHPVARFDERTRVVTATHERAPDPEIGPGGGDTRTA